MRELLCSMLAVVLVLPACGGKEGGERKTDDADRLGDGAGCADEDGDGYGIGGDCAGPDCNDEVAWVWRQEDCDRLCDLADAAIPGCPCDDDANPEPMSCYLAEDPETIGVGPCTPGLTRCRNDVWGPCEGQVLPEEELCDTVDNDCDGEVDEGVLTICGGCGECKELCWGPEEECAEWGENRSESVVETPEGHLTLDATQLLTPWIWLPAAGWGEILLVNRSTFEVEGHFQSGPGRPEAAFLGMTGDSPHDGAVTSENDFLVVNVSPLGQPSVSAFAVEIDRCVDVDGSGEIETSSGYGDLLPFGADECLLWNLPVGGVDTTNKPGGIAVYTDVGLDGGLVERAWLAMTGGEKFVQIDVASGELTGREVETPGFRPEVVQLDLDVSVWSASVSSLQVGHFDARAEEPEATWEVMDGPESDLSRHVVADEHGDIWVSGLSRVHRYDPELESWEDVGINRLALGYIESDYDGSIWVTASPGESVFRIDHSGPAPEVSVVHTPGTRPGGIEADPDGRIWLTGILSGDVTIIDPHGAEGIELTKILDDCDGPCLDSASPYGDLSGSSFRHTNRPLGMWSSVTTACEEGTDWIRLEVVGDLPGHAGLGLRLRTADTLDALPAAEWVQIEEGLGEHDLDAVLADVQDGRYLEVQAVMRSGEERPVLAQVRVLVECPIVFE